MIPIDPALLRANSKFEVLYKRLTEKVLDERDSSTRFVNEHVHADVEMRLFDLRVQVARRRILLAEMGDLVGASPGGDVGRRGGGGGGSGGYGDDSDGDERSTGDEQEDYDGKSGKEENNRRVLDIETRRLCSIIAAYLSFITEGGQLGSDEDHELLGPDIDKFRERIDLVAETIQQNLQTKWNQLYTIASAAAIGAQSISMNDTVDNADNNTNNQTLKSSTAPLPLPPLSRPNANNLQDLPSLITTQTTHLTTLRTLTVPNSLATTSNMLTTLLDTQTRYLSALIRDLELRVHGAESRHVVAKAQFLATVAKGLELKARVLALERRRDVVGAKDVVSGLRERVRMLDEEEREVVARKRGLERMVREFDDDSDSNVDDGEYEGGGEGVGRKGGRTGSGKGDVLRKLGRRYKEIEEELRGVKDDVEKLERREWQRQ